MTTPAADTASETVYNLGLYDNERVTALDFALRFHAGSGSDDPVVVVDTAATFLAFLSSAAEVSV